MAGYAATPLERKLGVHEGETVFLDGAPDGFELLAATTRRLPRALSLTLTFHTDEGPLVHRLPVLIERTEPAGAIWICWPKKAQQQVRTRIGEADVRRIGLAAGLVDVKVAAIDDVWSGLRFVRRVADR